MIVGIIIDDESSLNEVRIHSSIQDRSTEKRIEDKLMEMDYFSAQKLNGKLTQAEYFFSILFTNGTGIIPIHYSVINRL